MFDNLEIFGHAIEADYVLVAGVVALFALLFGIKFAFKLIGRLFQLWQAAREVVLNGGELDDATRAHVIAAFDLLPDEDILGYRRRRFLFAPDQSLVVTQKRVSLDHALGPITFPISEIGDRSFPGVRGGRFVVGPFEIRLHGRNDGKNYGGMIVNVMGGPDTIKLTNIITGAIARHGDDAADERVPRQTVNLEEKGMDNILYLVIPAVPIIIGIALLAVTWSQFSQSRERLARGKVVIGKIVGYEEKRDYEEGTNSYYPRIHFTDAEGNARAYISDVGGMKSYDIGAEVKILYDPGSNDVAIKSFKNLYLAPLLFGFLGAVFFGFGAFLALMIRSGVLR